MDKFSLQRAGEGMNFKGSSKISKSPSRRRFQKGILLIVKRGRMVRYVAAHESCVYRSAVVTAYHYLLESTANSAVQPTTTIVHKHSDSPDAKSSKVDAS